MAITGRGVAAEATAVGTDAEGLDPARGSVSTWLLTLTHHRAVDAVRRDAGLRRHTRPAADDREVPAGPGADGAAIASVVAGQVRGALAELPPAVRETLAWPTSAATPDPRWPRSSASRSGP